MKPKKLTDAQVQSTLTNAIDEAVQFIESEIAPDRIKAQKYYSGKVDLGHEEGRSKVVATKCRDTVRAIKPALMRVFLQSKTPVEFVPRRAEMADEAEQKTKYAAYIFERNNGFMLLSDAIDDALKKKVGILKAWYEESEESEFDEYSGLTEDQLSLIEADAEILDVQAIPAPDGLRFDVKASRITTRGEIKIKAVAPEDFFVDRAATSITDCYVCGHSTVARVGDLVAMGFDFEQVFNLSGADPSSVAEEEQLQRTEWDIEDDEGANDPSMRKVLLTEAYMKMDIEGAGVPKLYKFICAGGNYTILDRELADVNPFAVFEVDPEAHAFFGQSLVDIIIEDQDASTSLLRGLLDNIAMVNNPRLEVTESQVHMEDVLNNEIGGIIRTKAPGHVREIVIGGAAASILPAIDYYDNVIRGKTGVSGAGMSLNADVLNSQSATGVNAAMDQSNQVSELIARHLAEGGMKQLFQIIVQLARQHPNEDEMIRMGGSYMPVDPRSWTGAMDMTVTVGLGTGAHMEKAMALRETLQTQMGIWQAYGPSNGLVTMTNIRATLAEILRHSGLHNVDKYYNPMTPEIEQQLLQQAAQAAQGQQQASDPNAAFLQAEQMKVSARVQADMAKTQLDAQKMMMEDDRERDKMAQELAVKVAELLAKTGVQINTAAIKAEQSAPRGPMNV